MMMMMMMMYVCMYMEIYIAPYKIQVSHEGAQRNYLTSLKRCVFRNLENVS
jgi:hypothetical protein